MGPIGPCLQKVLNMYIIVSFGLDGTQLHEMLSYVVLWLLLISIKPNCKLSKLSQRSSVEPLFQSSPKLHSHIILSIFSHHIILHAAQQGNSCKGVLSLPSIISFEISLVLGSITLLKFNHDIAQSFQNLLFLEDILDLHALDFITVPVELFTSIKLNDNVFCSCQHILIDMHISP